MRLLNQLYVVATLSFLTVGCLQGQSKTESQSSVTAVAARSITSFSALDNCNSGKAGAVVFDRSQSKFFACDGTQWLELDLKGAKGDRGDAGPQGVAGANGTNGANGQNGRDGIDGSGVRLAIKDGNQVKALFLQYDTFNEKQVLVMLPNGLLIHTKMDTGKFNDYGQNILYTDADCTGTPYTSWNISYSPPHVVDRVYVQPDNAGNPTYYYKAVEYNNAIQSFKSFKQFDTVGQMGICKNRDNSHKALLRLEEIAAPDSLVPYAPLKFSL